MIFYLYWNTVNLCKKKSQGDENPREWSTLPALRKWQPRPTWDRKGVVPVTKEDRLASFPHSELDLIVLPTDTKSDHSVTSKVSQLSSKHINYKKNQTYQILSVTSSKKLHMTKRTGNSQLCDFMCLGFTKRWNKEWVLQGIRNSTRETLCWTSFKW